MMIKEKEEQFRWSMEDGAFKTWDGKNHLIKRFKTILDRHRKRQMARNQILLGNALPNEKDHSKCYNDHTAAIGEGCTEENMFRVLIENYKDFDCFSMDMDQKIDELVVYGYAALGPQ